MKNTVSIKRFFSLLLLILLAGGTAAQAQSHVVISQVYGGGGNSGATYRYDFVELYNPTAAGVDLSTWSLQYASSAGPTVAGGSTYTVLPLTGTAQAGKYFLIRLCVGNNTSTAPDLPVTPDFTAPNYMDSTQCQPALAAGSGKIALVSNTTAMALPFGTVSGLGGAGCSTVNAAAIVDYVGYGAANCYEGSASTTTVLTSTTAAIRNASNADTGDNKADFSAVAPNPRSSGSAGAGGGTPTPTNASISTLQANRSTYIGTSISTTGIVTSVVYNGFFMQMPGTPASRTSGISEGIDVFTSTAPTVHVGDSVTVSGSLTLFPAASASVTPALEISKPTVTVNSSGATLPTPIALTPADLTTTGGLQQLTRYESMRVTLSLTATSGTGASGLSGASEVNETYTSNGYFYAVMTGTPRPFREPGVDIRDAGASALPSTIQRFDDNPERIYVATTLMNAAPLDVGTGATFANVTGILDFTYSNDSFYDPSRFIPDAGVLQAAYVAGLQPTPAALPVAGQATVAAFNIERFFNTTAADNKDYYAASNNGAGSIETSQAVVVAPAAYTRRLQKVSLAIRHMLNNPDIVAVEESENMFVLQDIAAQITADATAAGESDPKYVAYGVDNNKFYTNDIGGIATGFLVKSTVNVTGFDQFFNTSTFTPTAGTKQNLTTVNDRPPFVLHAGITRGAGIKDYPITVIVNHLKALPDTDQSVAQKKELQVEQLASLFQGYQAKGEHVLAVGDFNAFEFNDGYGDYLGTATNNVVAASATTVTPGKAGLVTPAAVDLALNLPANQRYSYVEDGSAQILDHVVASADIAGSTQLAYVHFNADFPNTLYNDATTPARTSDHDPALAYLSIPAPVSSATLTGSGTFANAVTVGVSSTGQQIVLTNTGEAAISITSFATTGDFSQTNNCGSSLAVGSTCQVNVVFKPAAAGSRTGTLTFTGSATVAPVTLSGTGLLPSDFSLTDASNNTATAVTLAAGSNATLALKLTSLNGFAGSVALTCTTPTAPTGVSCTAVSPVALTAGGTATANVVLTTVSRTVGAGVGVLPASLSGRAATLALALLLAGVVLTVGRRGRAVRAGGLLMMLVALTLGVTGCGDKSSTGGNNPSGATAGTYTYTVTATSGTLTHTETITLTVQ